MHWRATAPVSMFESAQNALYQTGPHHVRHSLCHCLQRPALGGFGMRFALLTSPPSGRVAYQQRGGGRGRESQLERHHDLSDDRRTAPAARDGGGPGQREFRFSLASIEHELRCSAASPPSGWNPIYQRDHSGPARPGNHLDFGKRSGYLDPVGLLNYASIAERIILILEGNRKVHVRAVAPSLVAPVVNTVSSVLPNCRMRRRMSPGRCPVA